MFSYKGIDSNYQYKRGTINATNEIEAMNMIKDQENVIIIISLKKVSSIKILNRFRVGLNNQLEKVENNINKITRKIVYKDSKPKKTFKDKIKTKDKNKSSDLGEKSPILKGLTKFASRFSGSKSTKKTITMDDEMYENLQNMFKEQSRYSNENYEFETSSMSIDYTEDLASKKVKELKKSTKKDSKGEKKIDWNLLDNDDDPEINKNRKIKVKEKEIIMFTKRLHIMLSSGVALLSSLILLQKTSSKNLSMVLKNVVEDIQLGSSFSEAIAKYPNQFNSTYVSLVAVGETSGGIERSLKDIIKTKEQQQKVSRKVRIVTIYPIAVTIVLSIMMILGSVFFLPMITDLYATEGDTEMPKFTQVVMAVMDKVPYIIAGIVIFIIVFNILRKKIPEVNFLYRRYFDKLLLKFPVIKKVFNASYMHSFSSTVGLMLKNGIRLSDTLSLTGRGINNIYIKNQIESMSELMIHGLTFSEAMSEQEHFDELLAHIVLTGEESGQMIFALEQISEYYETELIQQVDALMEIVQPVTIVIVGLIVGVVLAAVYLPILDMSTGLGLS